MHISDEGAKDIWMVIGTLMVVAIVTLIREHYKIWRNNKQDRSNKKGK